MEQLSLPPVSMLKPVKPEFIFSHTSNFTHLVLINVPMVKVTSTFTLRLHDKR